MRLTIDIDDDLLRRARRRAADEATTLPTFVADALRAWLAVRMPRASHRLSWRIESGTIQPGVSLDDRNALFDRLEGGA